jgi:putative ABC transport system permease protein
MQTLWQDLRYGVRMLLRQRGFTLVAVLTLALGIGANTAIFSVVYTALFKALPYPEPDRLMLVWGHNRQEGNLSGRDQLSFTDVADLRAQNTVFEDIATYTNWMPVLSGAGEPERVPAMQVGDGYFQVMKGAPLLGRTFTPEEQEEGRDFVVVLSHGLWQRRFGGDPQIVGKTIQLNSRSYAVVGVMPADFLSLPEGLVQQPAQLYRPVAERYDENERSARHLRAIARLKPGVTLAQARAELDTIAKQLEQGHPATNTGRGINLVPLRADLTRGLRPALLLLVGAVAVVLLIACVNVASLLLVRAAARQRETAIRAALGAGRGRLARQFLTEGLLLAGLGGAAGVLLAQWSVSMIEAFGEKLFPAFSHLEINLPALAFTALVSLVTGVLFSLAPALQFTRPALNEALKEAGRGLSAGRGRLRSALVVIEVALALALLICAGLLIRSVMRLRSVDPGFDTRSVLALNIWLPNAKYPNDATRRSFFREALSRISALPGVEAAGVTSVLPLSSNFDGRGIEVDGQPRARGQEHDADLYVVTPGYLETLRLTSTRGRALNESDTETTQYVALVNETMAQQLWPNANPLGQRIRLAGGPPGEERPWRTVVGVVRDIKQYGLDKTVPRQFYLPHAQQPFSFMSLVVRAQTEPTALTAAIRREVLAIDKDQPIFNVTTMEQLAADSLTLRRFSMQLLVIFAGVALLLAGVGIYGVIASVVAARTPEIGIRMALCALAATRLLSSQLYSVTAVDPLTYCVTPLLLAGVALAACWLPARRALQVDPLIALRSE